MKTKTNEEKMKTKVVDAKERPVLVTTLHKGVFFGYAIETKGSTIDLKRARMCVYWTSDLRGVVGLAVIGPGSGCKISPSADMEIRDITAVMEVLEKAVVNWEKGLWS